MEVKTWIMVDDGNELQYTNVIPELFKTKTSVKNGVVKSQII